MSEITFDIHGEYITDTVRELFYSGKITYDKAIDTLIHSMSGTEYMKWNRGKDWKNPTEYFDQEDVDICIKNIKEINKMAIKMTADEVKEFMEMDYSYLIEK